MNKAVSLAVVVALTGNGIASADVDRCATADTDLAWRGSDLPEFHGDTGWFPNGFVAQLRLSGRVVGHTAVEAGMRATTCWGDGMQAQVAGRAGTGWLDVAYGAEVRLRGRIHTSILGKEINWEADIPIPYIPMEVILEGNTDFDPAIDASRVTRVSDQTAPITLIFAGLGDLIDIVGISGNLRVTVTPTMQTSYRTREVTIDGKTIDAAGERVAILGGASGFGGSLDVEVSADGLIRYEPTLRFEARFDVKILGIRVVDWSIAQVSLNLPALERPMELTGELAHFKLPSLDGIGEDARMDFASGDTQEILVRNTGEAVLAIEAVNPPAGVTAGRVEILPGGQLPLRVTATDSALANGSVRLVLASNDPERGDITIELGKDVGGTDGGEEPDDDASAGGCSTGGGTAGFGVLLAVSALLRRSRPRRR